MAFADDKTIALATNHALTISPSILEDRTKDDGDVPVAEFDTYTWGISTDSVVGSNDAATEASIVALIDKMLALEKVTLKFDAAMPPTGAMPASGWVAANGAEYPATSGEAWIETISITAGSSGYATASVSFKGDGALS
jgi:hypothetical protein